MSTDKPLPAISENFLKWIVKNAQESSYVNDLKKDLVENEPKVEAWVQSNLTQWSTQACIGLGEAIYVNEFDEASKAVIKFLKKELLS